MKSMYYIGLDVHKKTISYCVKDSGGRIHEEGTDLDEWRKRLPQPWTAAMEATPLPVGFTITCFPTPRG